VSVLAAGIAWVALSTIFDFPDQWERIFQTLVAAVTLVMVFLRQPASQEGTGHEGHYRRHGRR
jgi:low affinity Fe/Cu permease